MDDTTTMYIIAAFAAFIIVGAFIVLIGEKRRTRGFEAAADRLGFSYDPAAVPVYGKFSNLRLTNQGHSRKARRLLMNGSGDDEIWIFDYRYCTGHGRHRSSHRQTVAAFPNLGTLLPEFQIRPEDIFHKIGSSLGYQDIDFDEHPEFSSRYLLRGRNEMLVRSLFTSWRIEAIMNLERFCAEGAGAELLVYRTRRVDPGRLSKFIDEARAIKETLTDEQGRGVRSRLT